MNFFWLYRYRRSLLLISIVNLWKPPVTGILTFITVTFRQPSFHPYLAVASLFISWRTAFPFFTCLPILAIGVPVDTVIFRFKEHYKCSYYFDIKKIFKKKVIFSIPQLPITLVAQFFVSVP